MKIGVIYYKYPLYPQGSYFQEFLNKLASSVEEIYLVAAQYPKGNFEKAKNIKIFWVPLLNIKFIEEIFFMLVVLFKVIFTPAFREVDLVNSVGPRGLLAGWYLKRRYKVPLVCTIELLNEKGSLVNNIIYGFTRLLATKIPVDKFICWSNYYWENHLKRWEVPRNKVVIIPTGINTERYNPRIDGSRIKKKYAPDNPLIVFAKPLYDYNIGGAEVIVRSIALLKPEIEIKVLIGSGDGKNHIQDLAKRLGVLDLISFMPPTPFPEIPKYIAAADLIVLPFAYAPTTSRSLLEAMAMGKPIVVSPAGETSLILKDGKHAILVKPQPKLVAEKIKLLLGNKQLSDKIRKDALKLIENKFSLLIVVNQTLAVFKELKKS